MADYGVQRGDRMNIASLILADRARDRNVIQRVVVGEVAIVEGYNPLTGRVDVKLKFDPDAVTRRNLPVLWGRHRHPLKKGDMGFLHHTHDDSTGGYDDRTRQDAETPGNHARVTPVFDAREPIVLADAVCARYNVNSLTTDYGTFGPLDEIFLLQGGSFIIVKSTGDWTLIPASGAKVRIGDPSTTDSVAAISKVLEASATWNPGSIGFNTNQAGDAGIAPTYASTTVAVNGAKLGDACFASLSTAGAGYILSAAVTADNVVTVNVMFMGSYASPGSGTLKVVVIGG